MTNEELQSALSHWGQSKILHPLTGGHRNQAWLIKQGGEFRVAKTTRRSEAAIAWLSPVHNAAEAAGFVVPRLIQSRDGLLVVEGLTVESYIEGEFPVTADRPELAARIAQFHQLTKDFSQRPTFASSTQLLDQYTGGDVDLMSMPAALVAACRDAWRIFAQEPQSVVHGDLNPSNILIMNGGKIALLDWDEARVDASVFDHLAIADQEQLSKAQQQVRLAWEITVCWHVEHDYAQGLVPRFMADHMTTTQGIS